MALQIVSMKSDDSIMLRSIDGAFTPAVLVGIYDDSGDSDVNKRYRVAIEAQIKETETDAWRSSVSIGPGSESIRIVDVEVGSSYNFRARYVYSNGHLDAWTDNWPVVDEFGTPTGATINELTITGSLRIPPKVSAINIDQSFTCTVTIDIESTWTPVDLEGYEIRYYLGTRAELPVDDDDAWDAMSLLNIVRMAHYETSVLTVGHYTFAAKLRSFAVNPVGDNITTFPKFVNESEVDVFEEFDVVDGRNALVVLGNALDPEDLSTSIQTVADYQVDFKNQKATDDGVTYNALAGTITVNSDADQVWRITLAFLFSGSPTKDKQIEMYFIGDTLGNNLVMSNYCSNHQDEIGCSVSFTRPIPADETLSMGVLYGAASTTHPMDICTFEMQRVS